VGAVWWVGLVGGEAAVCRCGLQVKGGELAVKVGGLVSSTNPSDPIPSVHPPGRYSSVSTRPEQNSQWTTGAWVVVVVVVGGWVHQTGWVA
jgi:hypothetical protein